MRYTLILLSIIIISFKNVTLFNRIENECRYKGGIEKAVLNKTSGDYSFMLFQLGEKGLTMDIDSCKMQGNLILLKGTIWGIIPKKGEVFSPMPQITIIKAIRKKKQLTPIDTLTISNAKGGFSISTCKFRNEYIIIRHLSDSIGTVYSLEDFK